MASKVGTLIKEARTNAGMTQEKLAKKVGGGLDASDISKAERGELALPTAALKKIAVATGVTQASLVNAAKGAGSKSTANKTTAKKKKATTPSNAGISMRVTSTEKKLIEYYRNADSSTKKAATNVLQGKCNDLLSTLESRGASSSSALGGGAVADIIGDVLGGLLGGK